METITRFGRNVLSEVTANPMSIAQDALYGVATVMVVDMTPIPDVISNAASMVTDNDQRQPQIAAGMTYATLAGLHRAWNRSMGY